MMFIAIFGKYSTGGQIIIDPKNTYALLYSANFFKEYSSDDAILDYKLIEEEINSL